MRLRIDPAAAERELAEARRRVSASGLPQLLSEIDAGAFGTTPLNLGALDAVAQAAAVALALSKPPAASGRTDALKPLYLGFLLAEEAEDRLLSMGGPREAAPQVGALAEAQYKDLEGGGPDALLASILKDCCGFLRFYRGHPDAAKRLARDTEALDCLRSYFRLLSNTLRRLQPDDVDAEVETPRLRVQGWRVSPVGMGEPAELLPVTFDDIVGNEEYAKSGKRLARDVAGFDFKAGKNPKNVRNQILFVLGSPGCGKTVTAHAILRYFLGLCEGHEIPAATRIIRRTDWASAYQNQSASRLLDIFRDEIFNAPGVCAAYWPDIDTAFAARSDSDIRQEEKANLGTLFGILDGTVGPKNGKWLLICDANTLHMDEATLSRLSQSPLRALGPVTAEDFARLLRDVKLRGKENCLPITAEEWKALGDRCVQDKLSGRSIDNIAGRVLAEIEDFDQPDDYYSLSFEEKRKVIERLSKPVPAARILALLEDHCRFEREAMRRAEEENFQRRVSEIRLHLSAERAAVEGLAKDADAAARA